MGYTGQDAVWRSLVEHELAHTIVAEIVLREPSPTLRHEAGLAVVPLAVRWWEESLALSLQHYANTGRAWRPIQGYLLAPWRHAFTAAREALWAALGTVHAA